MKKQTIKFTSETIVKIDSNKSMEVIVSDGQIFVPLVNGLEMGDDEGEEESPKKPAAKPAASTPVKPNPAPNPAPAPAPVADDTAAVSSKRQPAKAKAPVELSHDDLEIGQKISVELDIDGKPQMFGADIIEAPAGKPKDKIWIQYHADKEVDYLRDTDKVFEFVIKF